MKKETDLWVFRVLADVFVLLCHKSIIRESQTSELENCSIASSINIGDALVFIAVSSQIVMERKWNYSKTKSGAAAFNSSFSTCNGYYF